METRQTGLGGMRATDIAARCEMSEASRAIAQQAITAEECLQRLIAAGAFADAVNFLAFALPPRELVGWGCLCVRKYAPAEPDSPPLAALEASERWVAALDEASRRAAFAAGEKDGFSTPASMVAAAALFSGGSIAPEGVDPAPPPHGVVEKVVAGAVNVCAASGDPAGMRERYEGCLALGRRVAQRLG